MTYYFRGDSEVCI